MQLRSREQVKRRTLSDGKVELLDNSSHSSISEPQHPAAGNQRPAASKYLISPLSIMANLSA